MKKIAIIITTIFVMLMMVSSVSAVPYEQYNQSTALQKKARNIIHDIRNSPNFLKLEKLVNEKFPEDKKQFVSDTIRQFFIDKGIPLDGDEDLLLFLIIIAELIMLIFGQNIVGKTLAFVASTLVAIPYSFILGFGFLFAYTLFIGFLFLLLYILAGETFVNLLKGLFEDFLYTFGLFFGSILVIVLLVIGLPIAYIVSVIFSFFYCIDYMFNYIFVEKQLS